MTRTDERKAEAARAGPPKRSRVRADIQGLRAIAVVLVLIYHLHPEGLPGGYVGVDVFFVISGFLITGQLFREAESSGRIDLPRFWARRARRLLPAALIVLGATLLAVWLFAPSGFVPAFLLQVAASAVYVQNWVLAGQAVDYMAAEAQVSPVQHYWSLSVEEQFYIVWPLIAVTAAWIALKRGARVRRVLGVLIGLTAVASLLTSVTMTASDPAAAYFATTTRAWEFALGGLLALIAGTAADPVRWATPVLRASAAWIGLAGIASSAIWFSDATPFPGYTAALPVVATALVIAVGEPDPGWSPRALLAAKPMQWLGDASYGVYLWHFPLIILLPFALGRPLGLWGSLGVTAATLLLAWASKELVEDPFRTSTSRDWPNGRTLAITAIAMAVVLACSMLGVGSAEQRIDTERERVAEEIRDPAPCLGAEAVKAGAPCEATPRETPIPEPDLVDKAPESCLSGTEGRELVVCEYGADADADRSVALLGDSHAEQWLAALVKLSEQENWRLLVMTKASCPFTAGERDFISKTDAVNRAQREDCTDWNRQALEYLDADPRIDTVFTAAKSTNRVVTLEGEDWREAARRGYLQRWSELPDSVRHVVAIRDTPRMPKDVMKCVTENGEEAARVCSVSEREAFSEDPLAEAAKQAEREQAERERGGAEPGGERSDDPGRRVTFVDLSGYFVADGMSPPVIGGVLAFRDSHHVSWAYAEMLADPLGEAVEAAFAINSAR